MYPRPFEYLAPKSIEEALDILAREEDAKVLAGGQSLLPLMKLRLLSPRLVVDIGDLGLLRRIERDGNELVIGALVRHSELAVDPQVRRSAAALAASAAVVGDVQVRNRGTLGGSLCHGDAVADEPAAVIALDATMVLHSNRGRREIPAAEFFVDTLTTACRSDELLVEVRLPATEGIRSAYRKIGRRGPNRDYPVVGIAAATRSDGGLRMALTGAGSRPQPLPIELLSGGAIDVDVASLPVLADLYGSADYKRHLISVLAGRVAAEIAGRKD